MSKKAIRIFFCFGLLMTFSPLQADVLKDRRDGTIAAVGHLNGADDSIIYWTTCEGKDTTFTPRKGYVYKPGNNDCQGSTAHDKHEGERPSAKGTYSKQKVDKDGWIEVPVTKKR